MADIGEKWWLIANICRHSYRYCDKPVHISWVEFSNFCHLPLPKVMLHTVYIINSLWLITGKICQYRSMCQLLKTCHHLLISNETVFYLILQQDGPVSVNNHCKCRLQRRTWCSRGPNDTWHLDGYDKLKPCGFEINGWQLFILQT